MPTWNEVAWAAFMYGAIGGDRDYQDLMQNAAFLTALRTAPTTLPLQDVQKELIVFLNRWKCRMVNSPAAASAIVNAINTLLPHLGALSPFDIETVNFMRTMIVAGTTTTVSAAIELCYQTIIGAGHRIAATATTKLLHILQPRLFVMWDKDILRYYHGRNPSIKNSGPGFRAYLEQMQNAFSPVTASFRVATLKPPANPGETPSDYLNRQLVYAPRKHMAKYIDEFNWVTITNNVPAPPLWHP